MLPNLVNIIESDINIKQKVSYLNTSINVHSFNFDDESEITFMKAKIKEYCADGEKRTEGLLLFYVMVHCNSTLYVENWSQIVLGSLKCTDSLISREIPLKVMNRMLINFGSNPDYSEVFSKVIPEFLPIILNPDEKTYKLSCQSLAVCMNRVPEIAGTRVVDIEKLLVKEMVSPYGEITEAIGECFAALPMCVLHLQRKGTVQYKEIWCNIFMKILNTMHLLLNKLFKLTEDQEEYVDVSSLPVFDIPSLESDDDIPLSQIDIFKSLCQCMAKMMSSENRVVRLPVTELLETLFRIFQIGKMIKGQNQDTRIGYLKLGFPQMLNGAYVVLEALILNFPIIDQSKNFLALMNMSLNVMEELSFPHSSISQVRGSTWKLLNVWLKQYGSKGSYDLANNKTILQEILADIDLGETESLNSKQLKTSNTEEKNQKTNKIFVCTHALKVLQSLLEISSFFMEKNCIEKICCTILRISKIVVQHVSPVKPFPAPYSDEKCRKMLYVGLLSCAIYSNPLHSKCILEAQNIFNTASKDSSSKVRRVCHRFRRLSRYYLNPRKPPPDVAQYSHSSMLNMGQEPVIESVRSEWNGPVWNSTNDPSSDDQMDDSEAAQIHEENAYSDKMESEGDLMAIEENEGHMNNDYRRIAKQSSQSMGEDESIDDSDIEPTYVSTDSNPQRISTNDSSHVNSFNMQSCIEQYAGETRTERHASEEVDPNSTNNVENNREEHISSFVEVKSAAQKPLQALMGNGEWKKKENTESSDEDDSDMDEEGEEEGEINEEEVSDNAGDEASDGKRSPGFDEDRPSKRQKCVDEEGDDDVDEDVEDEDVPVNSQSTDEEENEVHNLSLEQITGGNSENIIDEEDNGCGSPTIREMCGDFVLAEPSAPEIS